MNGESLAEKKKRRVAERVLFVFFWAFGAFHLLMSAFPYVADPIALWEYERWIMAAFLLSGIGYMIAVCIKCPESFHRIRERLKRLINPEAICVAGFVLWYVIVFLVRQRIDGVLWMKYGHWWIVDMLISACFLFPLGFFAGIKEGKKWMEASLHIFLGLHAVFTLWCLWEVFHMNTVTLPSGAQVYMRQGRTLQIGCHYNITGAIAASMFAGCLYMVASKKSFIRILYIAAGCIQMVALLLSNSRTVFLSTILLIACWAGIGVWQKTTGKRKMQRICMTIAVTAFICLVFWWLRTEVFVWYGNISINALAADEGTLRSVQNAAEESVRELNNLSGREKVWRGAIRIMLSSPETFFFGVTPFKVTDALREIGGLTNDFAHAHNVFLQVGVSFGVPMMLAFNFFSVRVLWKGMKVILRGAGKTYQGAYMAPVIVLFFIAMNQMEAYLVAYFSIMSYLFFLMCGWTCAIEQETREIRTDHESGVLIP